MLTEVHEREALMRVREVADELGQHPATIYRKITAGEIPSVRLGPGRAAIRVPRAEFERWLFSPPPKPPAREATMGAGSPRGGLEGDAA